MATVLGPQRYPATLGENQAEREGGVKVWEAAVQRGGLRSGGRQGQHSHIKEAEKEGISGGREWPLNVKCDRGSICPMDLAMWSPLGNPKWNSSVVGERQRPE